MTYRVSWTSPLAVDYKCNILANIFVPLSDHHSIRSIPSIIIASWKFYYNFEVPWNFALCDLRLHLTPLSLKNSILMYPGGGTMVTFCTRVENYFSWVGGFVNVVVQMVGVPRGHSSWLLIFISTLCMGYPIHSNKQCQQKYWLVCSNKIILIKFMCKLACGETFA